MALDAYQQRLLNAAHTCIASYYSYQYNTEVKDRELKVVLFMGDTTEVSHFSISWLPGNARVVIFHSVAVEPAKRGQGLGDTLHRLRLAIAKEFGATTALCTTRDANSVENRILQKHNWHRTLSVGNDATLWAKNLLIP